MNRSMIRIGIVVTAFTLAACSSSMMDDQSATPPPAATQLTGAPSKNLTLGLSLGGITSTVANLPLVGPLARPVLCLLPDTVGANIGPNGGSITLGAATFTVPAHALTQNVKITMQPILGGGIAVQFSPEGLHFTQSVKPTLTFNTDCIGNPANSYVVYTDDSGHVLERETTVGRTAHSITAEIPHFSRYAIAW